MPLLGLLEFGMVALSELQLFRSGSLEKTNLCFALFADIRFFVNYLGAAEKSKASC